MARGEAGASAPGRCTLTGEHVDYAGGMVVALAVDRGVTVTLRESPDGVFRARSGERTAARADPGPVGDIGDRIFAAVAALRAAVPETPAIDATVTATLPQSAGLASSAAVTCATLAALLRLTGRSLTASAFADTALRAERDIVGVPCGPLDQLAIVHAHAHGALLIDCAALTCTALPWPPAGVVLCICATGEAHDVGGALYRARRAEVDAGMAARLRHISSESARSAAAADALRGGDAVKLGALMTASHRSLQRDMAVSTPGLDAVVDAALCVEGVLGARLVGAGFGGSVVALARDHAVDACLEAMRRAAPAARGAWRVAAAAGMRALHPDVISSG